MFRFETVKAVRAHARDQVLVDSRAVADIGLVANGWLGDVLKPVIQPLLNGPGAAGLCDDSFVSLALQFTNLGSDFSAKDTRVGAWAAASNVELACTPTNSSWLNRIEAQFTALRYFALDGTDHTSHKEQASMIRRYIIWRNNHAYDERLRRIIDRANIA